MKTVLAQMFANRVCGTISAAKEEFEKGNYLFAGEILASHCSPWAIWPEITGDFKIIGQHYLAIAVLTRSRDAAAAAMTCCAALRVRPPEDEFVAYLPDSNLIVFCMRWLSDGHYMEALKRVGGLALYKSSLAAIKDHLATDRENRDEWQASIMSAVAAGNWAYVGALCAAAITWEKNR